MTSTFTTPHYCALTPEDGFKCYNVYILPVDTSRTSYNARPGTSLVLGKGTSKFGPCIAFLAWHAALLHLLQCPTDDNTLFHAF
jgi:hypothetical protein